MKAEIRIKTLVQENNCGWEAFAVVNVPVTVCYCLSFATSANAKHPVISMPSFTTEIEPFVVQ